MPTLWKDIFFQGNLLTATELVKTYLERSCDCLQDIDLDLESYVTRKTWVKRIEDQLNLIVEHEFVSGINSASVLFHT